MILTKSEISALYVSLFGRASEGAGNKYWQDTAKTNNWDYATVANKMLETKASKDFFGKALDSDAAFINHIYATTLNKGVDVDEAGKAFWIQKLTNKEVDRGAIVSELVKAALNPAYAHSKDPATKAAHELLTNKVIMSNVIADTVENIPAGKDIKEQLKPFVDINSNVKPIASKEDLKKIISDSKSALKIEENKLDTSVDTNSKAKILSEILHKPEKQIQKELDIDHTPKPKPDDTPKPKPDEPKNPDINDDSKDIEANLVQKAGGFFARVTQEGKHYFIDIKDTDNAGINLQADSKIILRGEQIFLKEGYKSLKAGIYTLKEANVDPTKAQLEAEEKIISVITPNKDKFIPKDQENGIKASDFNSAIINTTEGYITKSDGKTLIEGTLNGNEATNVKDDKQEISNIYKIVKNGVVTYQIQSHNNIKKGFITIDAKHGDIIDFIDDTQSITRVDRHDENAVNNKQFMLIGNDLHIIIYGQNAGDLDPNDDLVIIFKNVNLGKINIGQSAQGTSTGKFTLHQNILKEGLQKISDDDGFANLIGGENKTLFKIPNIDSLYKDVSGKYFEDAQGEQEIEIFDGSNKLSLSRLKFTDGNIYLFHTTPKKIDKTELENYTADKVLEKSEDGDQLITQNGIYIFSAPNKVSIIQSKNQDFEFMDTDNNDNITLEQAKSITKEKILNGEIETFINDGDKVKLKGTIALTFGENQEIKSIQNIIYADTIDILSKKIKDKIKDGAIEFKDTQAFDYEKLHSLISHTSKIKDSSIQNISLSIDEFLGGTVATLSNKIKSNSIALTNENPFTLNQLKSIINKGNSSKIQQNNIANIEELSIEEVKTIAALNNKIQAQSISITKSTSAQIVTFIEDELGGLAAIFEDIKIIKSSDGQEISLKAEKILGKTMLDFLSPEDKIKITNVDNSEREYIAHQNVDKFTIKSGSTLNLTIEQFKIAQSKLDGDGKIAISNVKDEIEGSSADDTFVIANNVSNLTITKFDVSKDKINFGGLGIDNKELNLASSTTDKNIANNTIYEIELGEALEGKDFGGANFDELFGAGKKFNITAPSSQNAVVIVTGNDKTQIYKIANTDATFDSNDVSLLGTISGDNNSAVNLGDSNII